MQLGCKTTKITTIEACKNTREQALKNFESIAPHNITSLHSTFDQYLENSNKTVFDLIFVDGHHDGQALLNYMESLREYSDNETIFILDDIRWSDSMLNAWNTLISSDDFHITYDLFRFGVLIRKTELEKEMVAIRL
jgi:predicted O-methyltransferase YrrM